MAARRSRSLVLAFVATSILLVWNLFHDRFLGSLVATLVCFALAGSFGAQAIRLAWLSPKAEAATPRL
ncbi:MAG: hypothetical protein Q8M73_09055 [Actinomycetota bacterium]|nr:hypothetical protein [Actinomycetota bacterium]